MSERVARPVVVAAISDILSGVDSWTWRLERAFREHPRFDFRVLVCNRRSRHEGVPVVGSAGAAARYLRETQPAILLPNYAWPVLRAACRAGAARPAVVAYCHSDSLEEYYNPLLWYAPVVEEFVAVSRLCQTQLARRLPERSAAVHLLPYGVSVPLSGSARIRTEGPLRLVYVGRLVHEQKRVLDFVPFVSTLRKLGVAFRLTLVGDGPERAELERRMEPFHDLVTVQGAVCSEAVARVLSAHDVFVQLSEFEGTSNSLLESMAVGTVPVVTETRSGIEDVLGTGEAGFTVPVGDPCAAAGVVARLAEDPDLWQRASRASHVVAGRFSIESNVDALVKVFDAALSRPRARWPAGRALRPELAVREGVFVPRRFRWLRERFLRRD